LETVCVKKIALISDTFYPEKNSGAIQLADLANELKSRKIEVIVIIPSNNIFSTTNLESDQGIEILKLGSFKRKKNSYLIRAFSEFAMPYLMIFFFAMSNYRQKKYDGIIWYSPSIFFSPFVRYLLSRSRCKSYLILRDIFPNWAFDLGLIRNSLQYYFLRQIANSQYKLAHTIGIQSPGDLAFFKEINYVENKIEVLNNWLSPLRKKRFTYEFQGFDFIDKELIIYSGNMGIAQDMDLVFEMIQQLQFHENIVFIFVGKGERLKDLLNLIIEKDLKNSFYLGEISPELIPNLYSKCSAGIVSLDQRHTANNIPGKFISYLRSGLPVIAMVNSNNDIVDLILHERLGIVYERGDFKAFVNKIPDFILEISNRELFRRNCIKTFNKFFRVEVACTQILNGLGL
jgi:glycosyltransferase involved in cell wall biosynthesis